MLDEPWVSAVVEIRTPEGEPAPGNAVTDDRMRLMAAAKTHFTNAGFEVHAPLTNSFSIGAKQSLFESVFGVLLKIDQDQLASAVTTQSGEVELPLEPLPEEVRAAIRTIAFPPPPPFAT